MESYIVINGKKAPLTEEQLKMLGIETEKKNPFKKVENKNYYAISSYGDVICLHDDYTHYTHNANYKAANYCTDKNLMRQRAWHETLSRLLWRYSMKHDGDKIDWKNNEWKYYIAFDNCRNEYTVDCYKTLNNGNTYFYSKDIAQNAIKEIVEPFMAEHPDFVW